MTSNNNMKKIISFFCIFPLFVTPALAKNDLQQAKLEQMKKAGGPIGFQEFQKESDASDILFDRYCNPGGGGIDCTGKNGTLYTTFYCNNKTKPGIDRAQMDQDVKNYCDGNFDAISNPTAVVQESQQPETDSANASASASAVAQESQQPKTDSANASASASADDADTVVETITVTGTVILKDEETNAPADFAEVTVPDTTLHAYTDTDGKFTLKNVPQGSNIQITYVGQKTKTIQAQENMGTIQLEPDSQTLEDLVVSADACEGKKIPNGATALKWNGSICVPECKTPRYKLENNTCVDQVGKSCSGESFTDGTYKMSGNDLVCIINACKTGYEPDADGTKCVAKSVLSEKDSQEKIAELSENADKMHERENSTENKALGAAGMASVGIGGMQMASAMAEKNADADAELAMRAYLSTFSCDYGGGSVSGGTTNNELPGGNELIGLYGEYVNLANNLKARKAALDIRPGIESEPILDSATSGLYDDISDGITTGAYTSLARAIMDPSGADAAAWASRQSDTAQKLKTGAMAAGIGSVATLVGNQLVNSGEENQEKSADINASYEKSKRPYTPPSK